ncbi:MAG: hypothetical protein AAF571_13245 [Verrucomicrobiota bacterium]
MNDDNKLYGFLLVIFLLAVWAIIEEYQFRKALIGAIKRIGKDDEPEPRYAVVRMEKPTQTQPQAEPTRTEERA